MVREELISLNQFILDNNDFFSRGFPECWYDEETGYVWSWDGKDNKLPIFPESDYNDYFYLRINTEVRFQESKMFNSTSGPIGTNVIVDVTLVVVVEDADRWILIDNLITKLNKYNPGYLKVLSAESNRESVILEEMKYSDEEEQYRALTNVGDETIVSLKLQLTIEKYHNDCVPSPVVDGLLVLENEDKILLENEDKILLEKK